MANELVIDQYIISNDFFEKGYTNGNGPCTCASQCCKDGVWIDVADRDRILSKHDLVKQQMDETQSKDEHSWFEPEAIHDSDFPSGKAIGTTVINHKCAFLDKVGRCSIQLAAVAEGKHKWEWKPLYCILFPIEISDNVVGFDPMLQDDQTCCSVTDKFDTPLFAACKEELTHLVGEDGYQKMEEHYASSSKHILSNAKA